MAAEASGGTSYCDPLAAAFEVKPASGEVATDAQLADFAAAMEPAAAAAEADGNTQLADLFTLIAKINAAPDSVTAEETGQALSETFAVAEEVQAACGVDLLQ